MKIMNKYDANLPVLTTWWNVAQIVSLPISTSFHYLIRRPTFYVPPNARPT